MAIQIRRGTNAGWEASKSNIVVGEPAVTTDTERAFIGTGSSQYMELANLERIASAYDTSVEYATGDIVSWQGELYKAIAPTSGAFNVAYWDKMTFADILKDFREHMYDGYETNTIENVEIASFDNGASGIAVKDLQVDITAQQDLHGYSHPWAGGAGKNLLDTPDVTLAGAGNICNKTFNFSAGTYTISFYKDAGNNPQFQVLVYNGNTQIFTQTEYSGSGTRTALTFTISQNATRLQVYVNGTGNFYNIMLELNSSATTYEPYANICPINGFDEVVVDVTGTNIWDEEWELGALTWQTGQPASATDRIRSKNYIPIKPNTEYYAWKSSRADFVYMWFFDAEKNVIVGAGGNFNYIAVRNEAFTPPSNAYYCKVLTYLTDYNHDISINYPSTDHDYHAYNGNTYTTDLDGTYYGGTLDVTTGVLTLTHIFVSLNGSENWYIAATGTNRIFRCTAFSQGVKDTTLNPFISNYAVKSDVINNMENTGFTYWYFRSTAYSVSSVDNTDILLGTPTQNVGMTLEQFKEMLSSQPLQVLGELQNSQTVQLSPQDVETVYKTNNLWSNGHINVLVYRMTKN